MNFKALQDFTNSFPEYNGQWFIAGEGYGAVYASTLAKLLLDGIQANNITMNLRVSNLLTM